MKILTLEEAMNAHAQAVAQKPRPYYAMYSSVFGGVVIDPAYMLIPVDDHMVHRGDGVFEAMRCIDGSIYDADAHLRRLARSAEGISLKLPSSLDEIKATVVATIKASQQRSGTIRIFISRGPGDFSPNPYSTTGSQLYVIYTAPAPYKDSLYTEGATLGLSTHRAKPRPYCTIKSCNYLPNVLMKMEAVDRGLDFVISTNENGEITESSTENVALVTKDRLFLAPPFDDMLKGTTLERAIGLVNQNKAKSGLIGAEQRRLTVKDFEQADSALIIGTTMAIMPVKSFESTRYTPPKDLPWLAPLSALFKADTETNDERRTIVKF